ncbi:glycoside hydrolase family 2 TIM barrel-domain containing protein [Arcticibacter sp.]|uniref:glycoside hydrolase family 2 TIM barrel-domain containing protein n=1 Tax=Arcticibacter sp. TaxID=1872630 RepID=UPI00388E08D3
MKRTYKKDKQHHFRPLFYILLLVMVFQSPDSSGQEGRLKVGINSGWQFSKNTEGTSVSWENVSLPHTWNDRDVNDDEPGYYRAVCVYRRELKVDKAWKKKNVFLFFEGANQIADVWVNGKKAGSHTGGYTGFSVRIDQLVSFEEGARNEILVRVDNRHNEDIPPLSADFTFFGGIYRDVFLIATDQIHFSLDHGSKGIYVSTPRVSENEASLHIRSDLENTSEKDQRIRVRTTLRDPNGRIVGEKTSLVVLKKGRQTPLQQHLSSIHQPKLWSPESPVLYHVLVQVLDVRSDVILDEVSGPVGFRWFRFDAQSGFHLNGKPYKLIGASRHQDFKGLGNALPDSYAIEDVRLLKAMGGNFLRVAHYPQDPAVLEACDRLGLLASVEIPVVNAITETEEFYQNCKSMQVEMIRQNFNHPSVIIWAYMNEVLLRMKFVGEPDRQKIYLANVARLAKELEVLTRKEDPSRYTMLAHHGDFNRYKDAGLIDIPMITGWNLYQGWYSGNIHGFASFMDKFHQEFPDKPVVVTEYGADADPRVRSQTPERFDKSIEYSLDYHEVYLKAIMDRPFIAAGMAWNLADFNSETREETMPHINNKGLLTIDRKLKDLYRFYQSKLLSRPFIQISDWDRRSGYADPGQLFCMQSVDVFSNGESVELFLNGKSLGTKHRSDKRFSWQVPFISGTHSIEAVMASAGREYRDVRHVEFRLIPREWNNEVPFGQVNMLLGSKRIYSEVQTGLVWLPDQPYKAGGRGHIGGTAFQLASKARQGYGTDRNIRGTEDDPIYQTQQVGIQKYKMDVQDGHYELVLHFAELTSDEKKEALVYNLGQAEHQQAAQERMFDVSVNSLLVFRDVNVAGSYGAFTAHSERISVDVVGGKGIEIGFHPKRGEPILNAIQVIKKY